MATIPAQQARAIFTQTLIDAYRERPMVMSFLRSFFPSVESYTRYVSIEVQRGSETVAVDVMRGSDGNRNTFGRSTQKTIDPPLYREYFDATMLDLYDRLFGTSGEVDSGVMAQYISEIVDKLGMLQDKIERAYELQCSQVLETGIVTLKNGDNIDFKRKAESLVDLGAGNYWTTDTVNPYSSIESAIKFAREKGKAQGDAYNVIFGSTAWSEFLSNPIVLQRADIRNFSLDNIAAAQRDSTGGTLHGEITVGSYRARLWTYPEVYDLNGSSVPYVNPKKVITLPINPRFKLAFAAVPQLITPDNPTLKKGAYVFGDYPDTRKKTHEYDISSAGVAVPIAIDQMHTMQVVA